MPKSREPIGEIACPLCKRDAELHAFEERQKLNPDSAEGGRPTYPRKHFIICPPVKGYRGCGTILANGNGAQERMMDLGRVYGAGGKEPPAVAATAAPAAAPAPQVPSRQPAEKPAPKKNPFAMW